MMDTATRWYVVQTLARSEEIALRNLARQGFTAFLPSYERRRRHARRVDWIRSPLFPCYLFVKIDVDLQRWRSIASTIGVAHLVCNGETPAPVPEGIVEEIQLRVSENGLIAVGPKVPFKPGEPVQVLSGAFADQVGFFDCATAEERVFLLLNLLGRQVRVKLPLNAVAPAV